MEVNILLPTEFTLPSVLRDLKFASASEALVVFALSIGGSSLEYVSDFPEFKRGVSALRAKGVLKVKGTDISLNLNPLLDDEAEDAGADAKGGE